MYLKREKMYTMFEKKKEKSHNFNALLLLLQKAYKHTLPPAKFKKKTEPLKQRVRKRERGGGEREREKKESREREGESGK